MRSEAISADLLARSAAPGVLWAVGILFLSISLPQIHGVLLCLFASLLHGYFCRNISLRGLLRRSRVPLLFAFLAAITLPLEVSWKAEGPRLLFGSPEASFRAFVVFLRSSSAIIAMMSLVMSERIENLLALCGRLRIPVALVEVAFLVYAMIFDLLETLERMQTACEARQGFSSSRNRLRCTGLLASALWLQALSRARAKQAGFAARGLESASLLSLVDSVPASGWEIAAHVLALGAIVALSWIGEVLFR